MSSQHQSNGNKFDSAYRALNQGQKKAVDTIEGPVMVIAGPGTGKTQILALRIANILKETDTKPENILALTFSDAGRHAMKERLRSFIGDTAYKVAIHTFHSFAGECISKYPDAYPNIIGGRPATTLEKFFIIEDIINNGQFKELRPFGDPLYYVKKIPGQISDLKKEYVTPDIFSERIDKLEHELENSEKYHEKGAHKGKVKSTYSKEEKRITKLKELLLVYRLYQSDMRKKRLYDFEDMIVETVGALHNNEDMLLDLQETYQYILADEHQDVNESQNKILELLSDFHDQPNIFVVGDEKQAIYRFQGASLKNFIFFKDRFKDTEVISLTDNYRSTQAILNTAHSLIKSDDPDLAGLRLELNSAGALPKTGRQESRQFTHEAVEDEWLVDEIKKLNESGIPLEEIAVILRNNRDVEHFASLLRRQGIDTNASAESDILEHPITKHVENLLLATIDFDDERALFDLLLGSWWGINSGDLALVFSNKSYQQPLYKIINDETLLQEIGISDRGAILQVGQILNQARSLSINTAPHLVMQYLVDTSGFLEETLESDPTESVRVIRRLYDDIEAMVIENQATTLTAVVEQLKYRRLHNLPLMAPFIAEDSTAVQVMTAHKSKGLEFHTVFIPRAHDGAFGQSNKRDYFKLPLYTGNGEFEPEDDERRLFYVAMTRAKVNLFISSATNTTTSKICEPSRFLYQMEGGELTNLETEREEEDFSPAKILSTKTTTLKLEPKIIKQIFLTRGLPVTHLNNYLEDPLKYYYENLLRRPQPRSQSLMKGSAVHEVLERAVVKYTKSQTWYEMDEINSILKNALEKLPFGVHELTAVHEQCLASLNTYLPHLERSISPSSRSESSFRVILETDDKDLPEIPLTGKIDRIDYDQNGEISRVVDYKTGKPKSRNEIEGLTKNSNGNNKRQLVFYALLLTLFNPQNLPPKEFILSFVEPKKSGEVVEHSFAVLPEEIEFLKQEIIRVAKEIVSGEKF